MSKAWLVTELQQKEETNMCFQAHPIQRGKGEMARTPAAFTLMSQRNELESI